MFFSLLSILLFVSLVDAQLPSCEIYSENQCSGDVVITDPSFEDHRWFTPAAGSKDYVSSFQDYDRLAAHVHLTYAADLQSVAAEIKASHRDGSPLSYYFGSRKQTSPRKTFTTSQKDSIAVTVTANDGARISLDPIDFVWNAPSVEPQQKEGDYRKGQKGAIVELFMWPHADVARECEFLAKAGYMGVRIFPTQEQVMSYETFSGNVNPWYFAYQPVSYRLQGRMGSRDELRDMINTCRNYGVRVYADAVTNHFVGGGNDANDYHRNPNAGCATWGAKNSSLNINAYDTAIEKDGPSPMYTQSYVYTTGAYTGKPPSQEFPAAHMGPTDFHCERPLNSWTDPLDLNAGWLSGLVDVNTEKESVQERIADYLTDLLSIGFSGFRMDAAKHIQPDDIVGILTKVRNNMGGTMPSDFMTWLEVLLGGESDLLMCNVDSGYNYGGYLEDALVKAGWSHDDVQKVKIWNSGYPKEPQNGYCTISPSRNAVQNDDHDQQTEGSSSRDMGDQGCVLIKDCESAAKHRDFELKLFQDPNGAEDNDNDYPIRLILSSYYWQNASYGVPDGKSDCSRCTKECDGCRTTAETTAYAAQSCGYDKDVYTRPHRDIEIINAMRSWIGLDNTSYSAMGLKSC